MKKFWMIKKINGSAPNAMHETRRAAIAEAKRLAGNAHNGMDAFIILEAMQGYKAMPVKVKKVKIEDAT